MQQSSRTLSSRKTESPRPRDSNPPLPLPQPLALAVLLSVSMKSTTLGSSDKWNHTVFVFFQLASFPPSNVLEFVQVAHGDSPSFLRLDNIPLWEYITFCVSIHLPMGGFRLLALGNNAAMNTSINMWHRVFLKYKSRVAQTVLLSLFPSFSGLTLLLARNHPRSVQ